MVASCFEAPCTTGADTLALVTAGLLQTTLRKFVLFATVDTIPPLMLGSTGAAPAALEGVLRSTAPLVPSMAGGKAARRVPAGTAVLFTPAAGDVKVALITLTGETTFFTLALPTAQGAAGRPLLGGGRVATFERTFVAVAPTTLGILDGTAVTVAAFTGVLDKNGDIVSGVAPMAVLPLSAEVPDVAATVAMFTADAPEVQILGLASTKLKGFGTAAETAVLTETFVPPSAVLTLEALLGRRSDGCCDTVACCTRELEAERSDVAGMSSTLPRASVHFTNVGETTPFGLTATEAFDSTGLGAMSTGDEAVPVNTVGDGICMTVLAVALLTLSFASRNCEIPTSISCVVQ